MSEIDTPSHLTLQTGEAATRVTRPANTSDENSPQQQSSGRHSANSEQLPDNSKNQSTPHETAVTLSPSLSAIEAGTKIPAQYVGVDGEERPLLETPNGTFVVKYDPALQAEIAKLPPGVPLDVKITHVDKTIEARLTYLDPAKKPPQKVTLSHTVTLELTGLGKAPPQVRPTAEQNQFPQEKLHLSYRANDLFLAGKIAAESAGKINNLPIPDASTNYTLYEKAVPHQHLSPSQQPAVHQSIIEGNALFAQEQTGIQPPASPHTPVSTAVGKTTDVQPQPLNFTPLLHQDIFATVIKNIPHHPADLPDFIKPHAAMSGPLDNFLAGHNFTLRIQSIAVPDPNVSGLETSQKKSSTPQELRSPVIQSPPAPPPEGKAEAGAGVDLKTGSETKVETKVETRVETRVETSIGAGPKTLPQSPLETAAALSGIIINPGQKILDTSPSAPQRNPRHIDRYASGYAPALASQGSASSDYKTLYMATPASVIKFKSPLDLQPGTILNFSLAPETQPPAPLTEHGTGRPQATDQQQPSKYTAAAAATVSGTPLSAETTPSTPATSGPLASPSANATALPLQPLTELTTNWQALSQIAALMPTGETSEASRAMLSRIPAIQNPAQMTTTMVFFLAAIGARNPARTWLGPQITQHLEKNGQTKLLNRLDQDIQRIARLGSNTPAHEWRPALLPLQVSGDVTAIPILTRQVMEDDGHKKKKDGDEEGSAKVSATRFVVEVTLSKLGPLQVDGMLSDSRLNIIIHARTMLPPALKQKVTALFTTALEIAGYTGDLQFRDNAPLELSVHNIITRKIHMS